ncbi:MAG: nucleotidyl transferase AbiEii/AbiGii toxin family protein [Candidatus Thioglobus sp.]|uniref:nucleotidyl transferase AbiEii/AbiGii toxin family protein n=1 Tax=Candidatus Thioglobus sp. TaxID=2026721 RepID=UPI0026198AA4|nr:nucleotidyl transferase AbiEii/AbiGii toxin family protein [Candidatus Thioglobus sp.]MDC9727672.1 nucleotidyl transferase AbiEii/AbiGii toxin family protein [Candidatus Thioglobus sp.]
MKDIKNLECLLPNTQDLLLELIDNCEFLHKYVLCGGSALALYLCHRKSEDLDFFTYGDSFDLQEIFNYLNTFDNAQIINQSSEQVDAIVDGVKLTFFNSKWFFLKPKKVKQFNLSSIDSIAGMKVNTLFLRAKYRDYYDLYCLTKDKMSLKEIFNSGLSIMPNISFKLFAMALVYVEDIEDDNIEYLDPVESIDKNRIGVFFKNKLKSYSL